MLKIGKVIKKVDQPYEKVEVSEFVIRKEECSWTQPILMELFIDSEPFNRGGFREVYKATRKDGKKFVVKKFLGSTLETIEKLNDHMEVKETAESFARRAIQTHILAKNFADQFVASLIDDVKSNFGKMFYYHKAFFGKLASSGESVMIEEYLHGECSKYINNDGTIYRNISEKELILKAECLCHFSYEKSKEELLLVDIQGCKYNLYDPEIASVKGASDEQGFRFCLGNLSCVA